jgi:hypothetical protein
VWIDGVVPGETMVTRQKYEKRLPCHQLEYEIGILLPAEESDIKLAPLEVVGQGRRVVARGRRVAVFCTLSRRSPVVLGALSVLGRDA